MYCSREYQLTSRQYNQVFNTQIKVRAYMFGVWKDGQELQTSAGPVLSEPPSPTNPSTQSFTGVTGDVYFPGISSSTGTSTAIFAKTKT